MKHKTIVPQNEKYLNSCRIFVNHSLYIIDSLKKFMLYFNIFFCSHYFSVRIKKRGGESRINDVSCFEVFIFPCNRKKKNKKTTWFIISDWPSDSRTCGPIGRLNNLRKMVAVNVRWRNGCRRPKQMALIDRSAVTCVFSVFIS